MDSERYCQPSSREVKCSSVQIMRQPACRSACRSQEEVTRHQAGIPVDAVEIKIKASVFYEAISVKRNSNYFKKAFSYVDVVAVMKAFSLEYLGLFDVRYLFIH